VVVLKRSGLNRNIHPHGAREAVVSVIRYAERELRGNDPIQTFAILAQDRFPEFLFGLTKVPREARVNVGWRRQFWRRLLDLILQEEVSKGKQESADKCDTGHDASP
jgi:hypothetical protein